MPEWQPSGVFLAVTAVIVIVVTLSHQATDGSCPLVRVVGSVGWFSGGVPYGFSFHCCGLASGDLGLLDIDHGRRLWDPFRRVWDPDIALVMRCCYGLDGEIGVGNAFAA
ncbi:hypothetical protein M0R45_033560 [Rubus argutus]|uniref:Uncharacterized protein n=1 Tax=Rubus argutus TaxID=59490 RepID=A0AAW1WPL8_RUBAR